MKINSPTQMSLQSTTIDSLGSYSANFEHWLIKSKHQDDEYYWQHQHQLQQSALTFDSKLKPKKAMQSEEIDFSTPPPLEATKGEIPSATLTISLTMKSQLGSTLPITETDAQKIHNIIVELLNQDGSEGLAPGEHPPQQERQGKPEKAAAQKPDIPWVDYGEAKNHQIFQKEGRIELAFNSGTLNPEDQQHLKHLIKKWVASQGLILQQFLINGVQQ